jgi:hypothetical protein
MRILAVTLQGLLLISVTNLKAEVRRQCRVFYQTSSGWAGGVITEVTFLTGFELGQKTHDFTLLSTDKYALIWFRQGEVAIIKLDAYVNCGINFTGQDFKLMFFTREDVEGNQTNDRDERAWKIAGKENFAWIDRRAAGF